MNQMLHFFTYVQLSNYMVTDTHKKMNEATKSPHFLSSDGLLCQCWSQRKSLLAQLWSPCCPIMVLSEVGLYLSTQSKFSTLFSLPSSVKFLAQLSPFVSSASCSLKSRPLQITFVSFFMDFVELFLLGVNLLFLDSDSFLVGLIFLFPWSFFWGVLSNLDFSFFILEIGKVRGKKNLMNDTEFLSC